MVCETTEIALAARLKDSTELEEAAGKAMAASICSKEETQLMLWKGNAEELDLCLGVLREAADIAEAKCSGFLRRQTMV